MKSFGISDAVYKKNETAIRILTRLLPCMLQLLGNADVAGWSFKILRIVWDNGGIKLVLPAVVLPVSFGKHPAMMMKRIVAKKVIVANEPDWTGGLGWPDLIPSFVR
ncbi:hypothetical protein [Candidatus Phyllobacterium onerii]|uniref:hypothetical protein n=1 Tax=Candidatus Phyllobacterium onerii TaxID=3020828 RepID=UPI002330046B|nr:hypothetical protein [Phyllobacterium sp. IY22]